MEKLENPVNLPGVNVSGDKWYHHFSNLHTDRTVGDDVGTNQNPVIYDEILNKPFTKDEFLKTLKTLKCGKASGFDNISNEMLKNSPNNLLDLLFQYINLCLNKSLIANTLCLDIIYPIHKDGTKSDPDN